MHMFCCPRPSHSPTELDPLKMPLPPLHQQVPLTPYDLPMPDGKLPKFPSATTKSQEKCQKQVYQVSTYVHPPVCANAMNASGDRL